jgi:hypothetical protein
MTLGPVEQLRTAKNRGWPRRIASGMFFQVIAASDTYWAQSGFPEASFFRLICTGSLVSILTLRITNTI